MVLLCIDLFIINFMVIFGFNCFIDILILFIFVLFFLMIIIVCFVKLVRIVFLFILMRGGVLKIIIWFGYLLVNLFIVLCIFWFVSSLVDKWCDFFVGIIFSLLMLVGYSIFEILLMFLVKYFISFLWCFNFKVFNILGLSILVFIRSMVLFCFDVIFIVRLVVVNVFFLEGWLLVIIIMFGLWRVFVSELKVFVKSLCFIFWYFLLICFFLLLSEICLFLLSCMKLIINLLSGVFLLINFFFLVIMVLIGSFVGVGLLIDIFDFLGVFEWLVFLSFFEDEVFWFVVFVFFCFWSVFLIVFFIKEVF